jgi:hypothetical protein
MAIFLIFFTVSSWAQVEKRDTTVTAFYKWDISFDLKPLFRNEEPFSLLVKHYTSPTKAWRFGLGLFASRSPIDKRYLDRYTIDTQIIFVASKVSNQINTYVSVGKQFEKKKDKLILYTSSDVTANFDFIKDKKGPVGFSYPKSFVGINPINKVYVDTIKDYKSIALIFSQSLGVKYSFNKQISVSFEANGSLSFSRILDNVDSHGVLTSKDGPSAAVGDIPFTSYDSRWFYFFKLNPLAHIYLSYHF